jgi:hypothetical protein
MKRYLPIFWTALISLVGLALLGITWVGESAWISGSGKHVEKGWPMVYQKQDFMDTSAIGPPLGPQREGTPVSSPAERYVPKGEAEVNATAFWIDVAVSLTIVVILVSVWVRLMSRSYGRVVPVEARILVAIQAAAHELKRRQP